MKTYSKSWLTLLIYLLIHGQFAGAQNSVLSSGDWYKIGVTQDGIYKLSYLDLQNLGIDISSVDPRNIRLFGNGAGMLPEINSASRPVDLTENSIEVFGEGDGIFDAGDYILFYGQSQNKWKYDTANGRYYHIKNIYSDTTYYFLTIGNSQGKRITNKPSLVDIPNKIVTEYDGYAFHELDSINLLHSGKEWYGESFDNNTAQRNFLFTIPNISVAESLYVVADIANRSFVGPVNYDVTLNGSIIGSVSIQKTCGGGTCNYAFPGIVKASGLPNGSLINIGIEYSGTVPGETGWLNYIEINARRKLSFLNTPFQLSFRDSRTAAPGNIARFIISDVAFTIKIWDVTDVYNVVDREIDTASGSGNIIFVAEADSIREYIVFEASSFLSPSLIGKITNQNLQAVGPVNMLIITHPDFITGSQSISNLHQTQDGLSVTVATTEQIYNEFSSGAQDITAIRDFIRTVYLKSTSADSLRYVLLMGDASYDFKNRIVNNTNFVPSYQTKFSLNLINSIVTDDFFALMDTVDGDMNSVNPGLLDLAIGRLPVKTPQEATNIANKIIRYTSASSLGDWRKVITFVADDQDNNVHFSQADNLAETYVEKKYCDYNVEKIYLDAYVQDTTGGVQRYPDVNKAIQKRITDGTLLINFFGQPSNGFEWARERVLDSMMINSFSNSDFLPVFASHEFNYFDDPAILSGGERILLNPNGGGIASFSGSRITFFGSDYALAQKFYEHLLKPVNNIMPRLGDFVMNARNSYPDRYTMSYILLGDPALRLAYPQNAVVTTKINGKATDLNMDTLLAGSTVTIEGEVRDANGLMNTFTGVLTAVVYDRIVVKYTLGNDSGSVSGGRSYPAPFNTWSDTIFSGSINVVNGIFSFSFNMPNNIDSAYSFSKISYYAHNGVTDASGCYRNFVIGGGTRIIGIDELENDLTVGVYPNPARDVCHFKVTSALKSKYHFYLFDIAGKLIIQKNNVESYFTIDLTGIGSGTYIYQIQSNQKQSHSGKLSIY